jgi:hypothetical protein
MHFSTTVLSIVLPIHPNKIIIPHSRNLTLLVFNYLKC